jgi:hypothetical protein
VGCDSGGGLKIGWLRDVAKPVYSNIAGLGARSMGLTSSAGGAGHARVELETDVADMAGLIKAHQALAVRFDLG